MKHSNEFIEYVSISAGMALAASCYLVLTDIMLIAHGMWALVAIAIAAAICLSIASAVSDLAAVYTSAPGIRTYTRHALGNRASLTLTFIVFVVVLLFAGVETYTVTASFIGIFPGLSPYVVATALLGGVVAVNLAGAEIPRRVQTVLTFTLIAAVLATAAYALLRLTSARDAFATATVSPVADSLVAMPAAVGTAIFLFMGFEWVTPLGRSANAYRKMIPLSMIVAIVVLTFMYVLVGAAALAYIDLAALRDAVPLHVLLGVALYGDAGKYFMAAVSLLAMLTTFNAGLMGASRLAYAVAREGYFPSFAARLSGSRGVPVGAILLVGGGALLVSGFEFWLDMHLQAAIVCAALYSLIYAGFVLAAVRHRLSRVTVERSSPASRMRWYWRVALATFFLPMLALATVASAGGAWRAAAGGLALAIVGSAAMAWWLDARKRSMHLASTDEISRSEKWPARI